MLKKMTIIAALLFTILVSSPVSAAVDNTSVIPENNPYCWHPKDCERVRKQFGTSDDKSGFISNLSTAPCNGGVGDAQWGRCLPAGTSKTEISFGGKSEFTNIGEFIVVMYKYMVSIASIVAVVMIIIAGAQWTTSGGNSEAISSAKKRISGAVIGLFIAYMSYFVLNTINPATVNLRLPQVWLVKPINLMPEFCTDIKDSATIKFAFVAPKNQPNAPILPLDKRTYMLGQPQACGVRYLAENGGETICRGNLCSGGQSCIDIKGNGTGYGCIDARLYGNISYSGFFKACNLVEGAASVFTDKVTPWDCPPIAKGSDSIQLVVVCSLDPNNPGLHSTNSKSFGYTHGETVNHYWVEEPVERLSDLVNFCGGQQNVKGFLGEFTMEAAWEYNRTRFVGRGGVDLGETFQMVGSSAGGNKLYRVQQQYFFSLDEITKGARLDLDAGNISDKKDGLSDQNKSYWEPQYQTLR